MTMNRRVTIALLAMGAGLVVLALALASVGGELDQARIDRDEYQFQAEDLQGELDAVSEERDRLRQQVDEQLKAVEQWKLQVERSRAGGQATAPDEPVPAEPAPAAPTPAEPTPTPAQ
jgi:hypothetical protein